MRGKKTEVKERGDYNARYYDEHKKEISAARKEKYASDPAYRAQRVKASQEYRERNKAPEGKVEIEYEGKKLQVHKIGSVVEAVGISMLKFCELENAGVIPKPIFDVYHRFYTSHQIGLLMSVLPHIKAGEDAIVYELLRVSWHHIV